MANKGISLLMVFQSLEATLNFGVGGEGAPNSVTNTTFISLVGFLSVLIQ